MRGSGGDTARLPWVGGKPRVESALEVAEPARHRSLCSSLLCTFSVACARSPGKVLWEGPAPAVYKWPKTISCYMPLRLFIQQVFIEHLLRARQCWLCSSEQNRHDYSVHRTTVQWEDQP